MTLSRSVQRVLAVCVTTLLLTTACTPEQRATYARLTGTELPADNDAYTPLRLPDGRLVAEDGAIIEQTVAEIVNALPFSYQQPQPVLDAFRLVAAEDGWSPDAIASWEVAVADIAHKEAQDCWNVRYGAKFKYWDGRACELRYGGRGASGFGQITSVLHPITCELASLCSGPEIVASPYTSMRALVVVIRASGVSPWCYSRSSRRFHRIACGNPGVDV